MIDKVIDIASTDVLWRQGKHADWAKIRGWGCTRAILRCTFGLDFVDPEYAFNVAGCLTQGIPFASYHLFKPDQSALEQLAYFKAESHQTDQADALDVELSGSLITTRAIIWLNEYTQQFRKRPLLYSNYDFLYHKLTETPKLVELADLWLSLPGSTLDPTSVLVKGWPAVRGLQYTFKAVIPGIPDAGMDVSRFVV